MTNVYYQVVEIASSFGPPGPPGPAGPPGPPGPPGSGGGGGGPTAWADITDKPATFPPDTHQHTSAQITDASTVGRAVMTAADAASARSAIGAGTSSFSGAYADLTGKPTLGGAAALNVGTTAGTVAAGDDPRFTAPVAWGDVTGKPLTFPPDTHQHTSAQIIDATVVGRSVLMAADAASARSAIGAGTSSFSGAYADLTGKPTLGGAAALNVGTTAGTVAAGDDPRLSDERVPTASGMAAKVHAAATKAAPDDADEVAVVDSASAWALVRMTWANFKAALKSYFDTLYQAASANLSAWSALPTTAKQDALVSGTTIKTVNGASLLGSGDLTVSAAPGGSSGQLQYNAAGVFDGAPLRVADANTLEQHNGASPQAQYIYNTRTDASNYERGFLRWSANVLEIGAEKAGTGTARKIWLKPNGPRIDVGDSNATVQFAHVGTNYTHGVFQFTASGSGGWQIGFGANVGLQPLASDQYISGYSPWSANAGQLLVSGGIARGLAGSNLNGGNLFLRGGSPLGTGEWGAVAISARPTAPLDDNLGVSQLVFYLDEVANALKVRVKYSDGTLKTATISLV